ncbi:MAG: VWA domain-containing protein [Pyrinomonadaceae bacterium]
MKAFGFRNFALVFFGAFVCSFVNVSAQESLSSASVSRTRAISNNTVASPNNNSTSSRSSRSNNTVNFTPPDEVAVEEFVNYHRHRLPLPKAGQAVAMDIRWGNDEISNGQREAVLQIGFTTPSVNERTNLKPLNLALVIDKSGSMADEDKMSRVKESLRTMLDKLREDDIVSIIVFDTDAEVLFPARAIGNGNAIRNAVESIQPDGSTNLHAGLMLGYREAQKNFEKDATNRVILLTDGIANVGTVDPQRIAAESSEFNGQGVDLSTIGVGLDLNNNLLRTLAKSGRGLYHFVSDYKDIDKVFVTEVQSLISSVAKNVKLDVVVDSNLSVEKIYGYDPRFSKNDFSMNLENMNNGVTQAVIVRFRAANANKNFNSVKVRLSYFDVKKQRNVEDVQEVILNSSSKNRTEMLVDEEVMKNYTIAELADSLDAMSKSFKSGKPTEAERFLNQTLAQTYNRYPNMEDKDIQFILDIVENYRTDLRNYNRRKDNGK